MSEKDLLSRAIEKVKFATESDGKKDYHLALFYYSSAVDLFSQHIKKNESLFNEKKERKRILLEKVNALNERAVQIRSGISENANLIKFIEVPKKTETEPTKTEKTDDETEENQDEDDSEKELYFDYFSPAIAKAKEATGFDENHDWENALKSYSDCLLLFSDAVKHEKDPKRAVMLSEKLKALKKRHDEVKGHFHKQNIESNSNDVNARIDDEIINESEMKKKKEEEIPKKEEVHRSLLNSAIEKGKEATFLDANKQYEKCLDVYTEAIGLFMKCVKDEQSIKRKTLLKDKLIKLMNRAEQIKVWLNNQK